MNIHTFDTRDFILWEVLRDYSLKSHEALYNEIRRIHSKTVARLENAGIKYEALKNTLTPQKKKMEIAFVFDSTKINDAFYGGVVLDNFKKFICNIQRSTIFFGDITAGSRIEKAQSYIKNAMQEEVFFIMSLIT